MEQSSALFVENKANLKNHYHEIFLAYFRLIKKTLGNSYYHRLNHYVKTLFTHFFFFTKHKNEWEERQF